MFPAPGPPVPTVQLAGLDVDVRGAIEKAYDEAVAQPPALQPKFDRNILLWSYSSFVSGHEE